MDSNKEFVKNTAIIFVGRICTQFISFLLLPLYTYYLSTYEYGLIDLIQTYIALFIPVIALRLDSSVFRFLIDERKNESNKSLIISNVIITLFFQIAIFILIYLIIGFFIHIEYYWLIVLNIVFMTISSVIIQIPRGLGDNIGYSITCCITGIITVFFNILLVVIIDFAGAGVLIASGIANIIGCIFLLFRCKIYALINIRLYDKDVVKKILRYSLPMIPDGLSWWAISVSDRTIISFFLGVATNGIYAVSSKFSNILSSFFSVINMSWQESASLHINDFEKEKFFSDTINNVLHVFVVLCLGILACIPLAFELLIGKEYHEALNYILILLLANLFNVLGGMFGGIYISKKMTREVARTTIVGAILNIVINLIAVKKIGLFAASISTLISYIVIFILRYNGTKKFVKIKFNKKMLTCSILLFIITSFLFYLNNKIGNVICFIVVLLYAIISNKKNILLFLNFIKNIKKG